VLLGADGGTRQNIGWCQHRQTQIVFGIKLICSFFVCVVDGRNSKIFHAQTIAATSRQFGAVITSLLAFRKIDLRWIVIQICVWDCLIIINYIVFNQSTGIIIVSRQNASTRYTGNH
jgi:hypothetical protein